jgi:hypothetical protein
VAPTFPTLTIVFVAFLLAGGLIAIGRKPKHEPVSVASGTAWYLYTAMATTATLALEGIALVVKVILGFINPSLSGYSNSLPNFSSLGGSFNGSLGNAPDPGQAREQDLILAIILIVIGAILFLIYWRMSADLDRVFSGPPEWRAWATPLLTTLFYGLVGIGTAIAALYSMLNNLLIDHNSTGPDQFGTSLGLALAFVPAWAFLFLALYRHARSTPAAPLPPSGPA